jgi:cytochrome c5
MAREDEMTKRHRWIIPALMLLAAITSIGLASQTTPSRGNNSKPVAATQQQTAQPSGEEVFNNNCARCHTPPMTISPRITGTVIMHMRVRARLSRQDEQLLLKYMAP